MNQKQVLFDCISFQRCAYYFCLEHEQEVVLLSQVLAHTCNVGYEQLCNIILSSLNGVKIKSLKHLSVEVNKIFSNSSQSDKNKSLVFEFSNGVVVVIDSDQAKAAQDAVRRSSPSPHMQPLNVTFLSFSQLCEEHFIPSPCSADLR